MTCGEEEQVVEPCTGEGNHDGTQAVASMDMTGRAVGQCQVVLTNPDGQTTSNPLSFDVVSGGQPQVWVEVSGSTTVRAGRTARYSIAYGNSGVTDAYDLVMMIRLDAQATAWTDYPILVHPDYDGVTSDLAQGCVLGSEYVIPIWLLRVPPSTPSVSMWRRRLRAQGHRCRCTSTYSRRHAHGSPRQAASKIWSTPRRSRTWSRQSRTR
jgi:hypothetical protein